MTILITLKWHWLNDSWMTVLKIDNKWPLFQNRNEDVNSSLVSSSRSILYYILNGSKLPTTGESLDFVSYWQLNDCQPTPDCRWWVEYFQFTKWKLFVPLKLDNENTKIQFEERVYSALLQALVLGPHSLVLGLHYLVLGPSLYSSRSMFSEFQACSCLIPIKV